MSPSNRERKPESNSNSNDRAAATASESVETPAPPSRLPFALAVLAVAVGYALFARYHAFDDDEFQHTHIAWLIWHGQTPYLDFFEHHLPLYHLVLAPLFALGSAMWQIFVFRGVSWACALGTLWVVYQTARRPAGWDRPALLATALLAVSPFFVLKSLEARPGAVGVLLYAVAASLALTTPPEGRATRWRLTACGLLCGAMVLVSQKFVFAVAGVFVCALVVHGWRAAGWMVLGGVVSAAPLTAWLAARGALVECFRSVVLLNARWARAFSPYGYFFEFFSHGGALLALGGLGPLASLTLRRRGRRRAWGILCLLAGGASALFFVPVPFRQTFLPLFPALAWGAALLFRETAGRLVSAPGLGAATAVFALAAMAPGAREILDDLKTTNADDLNTMRTVEAVDPTGGPVFDGRGLMFHRPHVGRHAIMHEGVLLMLDQERYAADTIAALEAARYPTVIVDYRVRKMPAEIQNFIAKRYLPIGDSPVHTPGVRVDRSRLTRRGSSFEVAIGGRYEASWVGDKVFIDGAEVKPGDRLRLEKGKHSIRARGFVEGLDLILVERQ